MKAEPLGVKKLATESVDACAKSRVLDCLVATAAVNFVAYDRMLYVGEVDAYLMCAACLNLYVQERKAVKVFANFVKGERREAPTHDGHARAVARVARDGLLYATALSLDASVDERDVGLEDGARAELV